MTPVVEFYGQLSWNYFPSLFLTTTQGISEKMGARTSYIEEEIHRFIFEVLAESVDVAFGTQIAFVGVAIKRVHLFADEDVKCVNFIALMLYFLDA